MAESIKTTKPKRVQIRIQSKNWVFTDHSRDLVGLTKLWTDNQDIIRFICWGDEVATTTGKEHYQGFIQMVNHKSFGVMKKLLPKGSHIEKMEGTVAQAVDYCKKEGKFSSFGNTKTQGQRSDLEDIKTMIDEGKGMLEIAQDHFGNFLRYNSGMFKYRQLVQQEKSKDFRKVEVILHKGSTGTGKTREAMKHAGFMIQGDQLQWWDGYEGEKTICIDEYANQVNITTLLGILDGYQLRLPIKGGFTYALWTKVYITTNLQELHEKAKYEHQEALNRRITKTVDFDEMSTEVVSTEVTEG